MERLYTEDTFRLLNTKDVSSLWFYRLGLLPGLDGMEVWQLSSRNDVRILNPGCSSSLLVVGHFVLPVDLSLGDAEEVIKAAFADDLVVDFERVMSFLREESKKKGNGLLWGFLKNVDDGVYGRLQPGEGDPLEPLKVAMERYSKSFLFEWMGRVLSAPVCYSIGEELAGTVDVLIAVLEVYFKRRIPFRRELAESLVERAAGGETPIQQVPGAGMAVLHELVSSVTANKYLLSKPGISRNASFEEAAKELKGRQCRLVKGISGEFSDFVDLIVKTHFSEEEDA